MLYFANMIKELSTTINYIQLQYNEHFSQLQLTEDLIVAYCGSMNGVTISEIEHEIEEKLNNLNLPKPEIKKIFFTCVELIQNQFLYSVSDEGITQNNYFIISKNGKYIKIITANLIQTSQVNSIKNKIDAVNSFSDKEELKSYYLNKLVNNKFGEKGGAGLGFITLALKSMNSLQSQFIQINEQCSLFLLNINFDVKFTDSIICPRFEGFNI
jgi:hypothetical protein